MCLCASVCTYVCCFLWGPEEGIRSYRCWELNWGPAKAPCVLNSWTLFPVPSSVLSVFSLQQSFCRAGFRAQSRSEVVVMAVGSGDVRHRQNWWSTMLMCTCPCSEWGLCWSQQAVSSQGRMACSAAVRRTVAYCKLELLWPGFRGLLLLQMYISNYKSHVKAD